MTSFQRTVRIALGITTSLAAAGTCAAQPLPPAPAQTVIPDRLRTAAAKTEKQAIPAVVPAVPVAAPSTPVVTTVAIPPERAGDTLIGVEDTITIMALNAEEISRAWRVSSAGDLNLPMVGQVKAAGRTVSQVEQEVAAKLGKYLKDPQVSLYVSEYRSQPVSVVGAVEKPSTYQLQGPKTVFDAVLMAGGPKLAGPTITLSRGMSNGELDFPGARVDEAQQVRSLELNTNDVMQGKGLAADIRLMAGDVVTVSNVQERKLVHIAGEVSHPGSVELVTRDSVSLMKVLAIAGGLTRTASAGKVMISRTEQPGGQNSTIFVNLKKIMSGKAKDLELSAGHIVIVPSSSMMTIVQGASMSAINTSILLLGRF